MAAVAPPSAGAATERGSRVELADIVRAHGAAYRRTHALARAQGRALRAIEVCRTATLGGHRAVCTTCGAERITDQLVSQPPLPQVSARGHGALARRAPPGAAPDRVLPRRLHPPS